MFGQHTFLYMHSPVGSLYAGVADERVFLSGVGVLFGLKGFVMSDTRSQKKNRPIIRNHLPLRNRSSVFVISVTFCIITWCNLLYFGLSGLQLLAAQTTVQTDTNVPVKTKLAPTKTKSVNANNTKSPHPVQAVIIICDGMVDDGMYESIKRRTEAAIKKGATIIIYQMDTFGGLVTSAIDIWNYIMLDVNHKVHTVAYIPTKAISAGSMISIACQDIIMKQSTILGDCAPIVMGGKLEGTEREKQESALRSYFKSAAQANGYPVALCMAMVTQQLEVYQLKNRKTGKNEYFLSDNLPSDPNMYNLKTKKLIVKKGELLTMHASEAYKYGFARAVVANRQEALQFLEKRDNIKIARPVPILKTLWSENMVRWLNSPTVAGLLLMIGMLGVYTELHTPGLGLGGIVAVAAFALLFGSKFLVGMANWWEIAVFCIGLALLAVEIFVIPGFGIAGISGILLIIFALVAMMVHNGPGQLPIPATPFEWDLMERGLMGMLLGFTGFLVVAYLIARFLPKIPVANRIVLTGLKEPPEVRSGGSVAPAVQIPTVKAGDTGITITQLRPSGIARFRRKRLEVVTQGELIEPNSKIMVVRVDGNSIVVKQSKG